MLLSAAKCARLSGFGRGFVEAVKAQTDTPFSGRFVTLEAQTRRFLVGSKS